MKIAVLLLACLGTLTSCSTERLETAAKPTTGEFWFNQLILDKTEAQWIAWHNNELQKDLGYDELALCDEWFEREWRVQLISLDDAYSILQINCNNYAYQSDYVLYRHTKDDDTLELLEFDRMSWSEASTTNLLIWAEIDAENLMLSTFSKSRWLGDCGTSATYMWDGEQFELTTFREKEECDGNIEEEWPVTFQK